MPELQQWTLPKHKKGTDIAIEKALSSIEYTYFALLLEKVLLSITFTKNIENQ